MIHGEFPSEEVCNIIRETCGPLPLVVTDPPYGAILDDYWDKLPEIETSTMYVEAARWYSRLCLDGAALYIWGGIGKPQYRPFYRFAVEVETETVLKNLIEVDRVPDLKLCQPLFSEILW